MTLRLQKFLAHCGVGSRRSCEELIVSGRISVNGHVVTKLGSCVDPATDIVCVNGSQIHKENLVYWVLNKPTGVVCSCGYDKKYKRVIDLVPNSDSRLYPAGRLDVDSEGLVIITNDGKLCNIITHPKYGVTKEYVVWLDNELTSENQLNIDNGITIDDAYIARPVIKEIVPLKSGCKVTLELNEGRNREIRKLFAALYKNVIRLRRIRVGSVKIGSLSSCKYRPLRQSEIEQFYRHDK